MLPQAVIRDLSGRLATHPATPTPTTPACQAANRPTTRSPPIVPLLGYFVSAPTEEAALLSMDAEADSVWLVYRCVVCVCVGGVNFEP